MNKKMYSIRLSNETLEYIKRYQYYIFNLSGFTPNKTYCIEKLIELGFKQISKKMKG